MLAAEEEKWAPIWREAHKIAAEEISRIESGICKQPGLAALLANFAIKAVEAENDALRIKHAEDTASLVGALAFYADPEIYHAIAFMADPPCGEWVDDFDENHGHPDYPRAMPGKRAREALAPLMPTKS